MEALFTPDIIISFITLSFLEIVLGIDNLIFIAIVVGHLPVKFRRSARLIGLSMALIIRIIMLMGAKWIIGLTEPVITIGIPLSFKDMLLLAGGIFLVVKGGLEIKNDLSNKDGHKNVKAAASFPGAIMQIMFVDFVFSFDSIITAIGMTTNITGEIPFLGFLLPLNITLIVAAVVISMIVMLIASGSLSDFLAKYPSFKILGISFIILIGAILVLEGVNIHVDKKYLYFALGFTTVVEILNTLHRRKFRNHS